MNIEAFWALIDEVRPNDRTHPEDCYEQLVSRLSELPAKEIVEWNHIFDQLAKDAYTIDQMAACYLINGGAGDDGFYYYRCWLIGMGRSIYEAALKNPDSLADVVPPEPDREAEAEIYAAAHTAWMKVTGNPDTAPYPARKEQADLKGEDWDFDDEAEMRRRMPRLSEMFL